MARPLPWPEPCPVCNRMPNIGQCEPWDVKQWGCPPWYAICYGQQPKEHCVGGNGDSRSEAVQVWNVEVHEYQQLGNRNE